MGGLCTQVGDHQHDGLGQAWGGGGEKGGDDGLGFTDPVLEGSMHTGPVPVMRPSGELGGSMRGSGARRGQKWKGGEVALHRKGPERDLIRCLRTIGESRSHKSQ